MISTTLLLLLVVFYAGYRFGKWKVKSRVLNIIREFAPNKSRQLFELIDPV